MNLKKQRFKDSKGNLKWKITNENCNYLYPTINKIEPVKLELEESAGIS